MLLHANLHAWVNYCMHAKYFQACNDACTGMTVSLHAFDHLSYGKLPFSILSQEGHQRAILARMTVEV